MDYLMVYMFFPGRGRRPRVKATRKKQEDPKVPSHFLYAFLCVFYMRCLCIQCDYAIFILTYYRVELVIHVLVSAYHVLFSVVFNFV